MIALDSSRSERRKHRVKAIVLLCTCLVLVALAVLVLTGKHHALARTFWAHVSDLVCIGNTPGGPWEGDWRVRLYVRLSPRIRAERRQAQQEAERYLQSMKLPLYPGAEIVNPLRHGTIFSDARPDVQAGFHSADSFETVSAWYQRRLPSPPWDRRFFKDTSSHRDNMVGTLEMRRKTTEAQYLVSIGRGKRGTGVLYWWIGMSPRSPAKRDATAIAKPRKAAK